MKYNILASFNTNKVLPSVGKIVDEVNGHMEGFGFSEKLVLRSTRVPIAEMTSDRPLFLEELAFLQCEYTKHFVLKFPESNPEIEIVPA